MYLKCSLKCLQIYLLIILLSHFSHVQLFVTPWTVACQAPLSMEFSRQEYWNGLPFPSPGDLLDPGIKPRFPILQADSLLSEPSGTFLSNIKKICLGLTESMEFSKQEYWNGLPFPSPGDLLDPGTKPRTPAL